MGRLDGIAQQVLQSLLLQRPLERFRCGDLLLQGVGAHHGSRPAHQLQLGDLHLGVRLDHQLEAAVAGVGVVGQEGLCEGSPVVDDVLTAVQRGPVLIVIGAVELEFGRRGRFIAGVGDGVQLHRHGSRAEIVDFHLAFRGIERHGGLGVVVQQLIQRDAALDVGGVDGRRGDVPRGQRRQRRRPCLQTVLQRVGRFGPGGDGGRRVVLAGAPGAGRALHRVLNGHIAGFQRFGQLGLEDAGLVVRFTVDGDAVHIDVLAAVLRRAEHQLVAVLMVDGDLGEQGRAEGEFAAAHVHGVDAHGAEDIPGGHLAVVLVADVALADAAAHVALPQDLADLLLGLVGPSGVEVHIGDVMGGLVAVAVLAHLDLLGLLALVDAVVRADAVYSQRGLEQRIQLFRQRSAATVEVGQSLAVLGHAERHVERGGLGVVVVEREHVDFASGPGAVLIFGGKPLVLHPFPVVAEQVDVVGGAAEVVDIGVLVAQLLGQFGDAVVIDVALDGPGELLVAAGGVAQEQALVDAVPAAVGAREGGHGGVFQSRLVSQPPLLVGQLRTAHDRVAEDDVGTGTHHGVGAGRRDPAGHPVAVLIVADEARQHLVVLLRRQQRIGRPGGAVGVPEAVVVIQLAVLHLIGVGAHVLPAVVALAGILTHVVGVEVEPVEVGVEGDPLLLRRALDLDLAQLVVPELFGLGLDGVKVTAQLLRQIPFGLIEADERGSRPHLHGTPAGEGHPGTADRERLVEGAVDEHFGHLVAVGVLVALEGLRSGVEGQPGQILDVQVGVPRPAGVAQAGDHAVVGGGQLHLDAVGGAGGFLIELHAEIVGPGNHIVMAVGADTGGVAYARHKAPYAAVAHPDGRLMTAPEAADIAGAVVEHGVAGAGLRGPEVEAVGNRHHGAGEAAGEVGAAEVVGAA